MADDNEDTTPQIVLMNEEEQYSLWPKHLAVPNGWKVMKEGTKAECLKYVGEVWTDMRPLSLRKSMEEFNRKKNEAAGAPSDSSA